MQHINIPRALRGAVRAEGGEAALFAQIQSTLGDIRSQTDSRLAGIEETVCNLTTSMGDMQRQFEGGGGFSNSNPTILPVEPEYSSAFASYFRRGDNGAEAKLSEANAIGERATIQAAMSVGDNSSGGYLAPVEWDRRINQAQVAASPMRRLAKVVPTSVGAYSTLWNDAQWGSGWVGETAARPETGNAGLSTITFAAGEIYAMPTATQRLLDDAAIDVAAWLVDSLRIEFNRQEGIAFLSGDGTNKPNGLLTYITGGANDGTHPGGNLTVVEAAIEVEPLIDFMYGLAAPYRQNATWLMSSLTAAVLSKLRDADGNLIWRESLIVGQPATLLGRPVEIDEGMPAPTAGNLALAFGDFNAGYLMNDRIGTRILRDPFTNKPFVNFYATKRVGAGVSDCHAIRLLQIPAA
ncbi:phage major capsid protein [Altererythrobacter luteolus]|uniref:Phage major capsid protein n=1 Tax=Pontixanthobacter luteolus TaxID=295089 RepID=A0A6I4V6J1_9SPHN|nr:phage major capsid protein [Pontixanthobacter luteolus]MXP48430.1 phage major capsid protein [Pontixanthobacter luteolus]